MKVIIHNRKLNDEIIFDVDEITEQAKINILDTVHSKGWDDDDCWSEVLNKKGE